MTKLRIFFGHYLKCLVPPNLIPIQTEIDNGLYHLKKDFDLRNMVNLLRANTHFRVKMSKSLNMYQPN